MVVEALMRVMHEFLLFRASEHGLVKSQVDGEAALSLSDGDKNTASVSMFYVTSSKAAENFNGGETTVKPDLV